SRGRGGRGSASRNADDSGPAERRLDRNARTDSGTRRHRRMTLRRLALGVAAAALAAAAVPAAACTPAPGYEVPSNLELVRQADAILLARVVGGTAASPSDPAGGSIVLRPAEALKGELPPGDVMLSGM